MSPFADPGPVAPKRSAQLGGVLFEPMRPAGVSPEEWRRRQAAELRAIVRRSLLQGAADPFR